MTNTCENITFPQLRLQAVKNVQILLRYRSSKFLGRHYTNTFHCRESGSSEMPPTGHFMPRRGYVVYTTGHMTSAGLEPELPVPLDEITLHPGEGIVIRFWPLHELR